MMLQMMKTGFVILLALVFSASQLCACMSSTGAAPAGQHEHQPSAIVMNDHDGQHDAHHSTHHDKDVEHDMHGGDTGCGHCAAPSFEASVVVAKISAPLSHPEAEKFAPSFLALADDALKPFLPLIVRGHAWLDPPPTTPITLKTRLLQ